MKKYKFKEYCRACRRFHIMEYKKCPGCGVYKTPQPVSDNVANKCMSLRYNCDGCEAYQEHLSI